VVRIPEEHIPVVRIPEEHILVGRILGEGIHILGEDIPVEGIHTLGVVRIPEGDIRILEKEEERIPERLPEVAHHLSCLSVANKDVGLVGVVFGTDFRHVFETNNCVPYVCIYIL
jgi:CBS domain-containing protein